MLEENSLIAFFSFDIQQLQGQAPDLGMGTHLTNANNQLQAIRPSDARRQFLSTLAPLTACVAGQRDDMSFYSLATGDRNSTGSSRGSEYSIGDIDAILQSEDVKKVAPDVIAGTPGQEQNDELAAFAQQEATRTERIKKRYNNNTETIATVLVPTSNAGSDDDDEQNDYGLFKLLKLSLSTVCLENSNDSLMTRFQSSAIGAWH